MTRPVATLTIGELELRTSDPLACRHLYRLITSAVRPEDIEDLVGEWPDRREPQ